MEANTGGRRKLEPDPQVRVAILAAASKIVREEGVRGFSIAQVLDRAQLSTRAFYRHFGSKDELVAAVFLGMASVEMLRLRRRMADASDPVGAVAAWIDGRLELAFNDELRSDLRQMSVEAQSQMFASPELIGPAYGEILRPLVEQLARGRELGQFTEIDPDSEALSIQGVVWSNVERQWATGSCDQNELRERVQRFCLRGLGVAPETVRTIVDGHQAK
ncbi:MULTISPECIES: TetR/AcrR family transcriptional regulator [unclassified Mycobacterium]|uniref:TetR/AcrR family transcriptional regulator n=1 Tax=unclassified Mycobacterium TaxID=2642494 RepID=UPI0029C69B74|nr:MULTISPECIES: TetR/AcrR family transcriptional regulator [unclassified Mycobacterium]